MPSFTESVHLDRSVNEVWAFLADPDNHVVWDTAQQGTVQLDEGPLANGVRWRGTSRVLGKKVEWTTKGVDVVENEVIAFESVDTVPKFAIRTTLAPEEGGTRLTFHIDAETGLGGFFGRFADPVVSRAYARNVRAGLENLAEVLAAQ